MFRREDVTSYRMQAIQAQQTTGMRFPVCWLRVRGRGFFFLLGSAVPFAINSGHLEFFGVCEGISELVGKKTFVCSFVGS